MHDARNALHPGRGKGKNPLMAVALADKIIGPEFGPVEEGEVLCRERLGGLLRCCYRDAA